MMIRRFISASDVLPIMKRVFNLSFGMMAMNWFPIGIHDLFLQSYPQVVHGGIQSTLLDEIAGWVVYVKCGTVGLTAEMKVKFRHPLYIDQGEITIRAKIGRTKQTPGNH